jgi:NADPH:quinone reductase-like Zn-dependent oxidoreductase
MNRFIETKAIKPSLDDRVFSFEEVKDAFDHFEGMGHVGKVCISVTKES